MKTFLYIDGFNLYSGRLKPNPRLKWLNPKKEAVKLTHEMGKNIFILSPDKKLRKNPFKERDKNTNKNRYYTKKPIFITTIALEQAQMPPRIPRDGKKDLYRPPSW